MATSFVIFGATGKQGGAVISSLLAHARFSPTTHTIYAVTRSVSSPSATRLAARSPAVKLLSGNFDDAPSVFRSLPSAPTGVFAVQLPGKKEVAQGKGAIDAAAAAGTQHFVFTSVERGGNRVSAETPTSVPHFATKFSIEKHLEGTAAAKHFLYTILRPVFFLDNLEWGFIGRVVATAWRDRVGKKLQVVDTLDIGWWGAEALMNPQDTAFANRAIGLAGDELTFAEANAVFEKETGRPIPTTHGFLAAFIVWTVKDLRMMFRWFRDEGFGVDVAALSKRHTMTDFRGWTRASSFAKKHG